MTDEARTPLADDPEFVARLASLEISSDPSAADVQRSTTARTGPHPPAVPLPPIQITPRGVRSIDLFPPKALEPNAPTSPPAGRKSFEPSLRQRPRVTRAPAPAAAPAEASESFYGLTEKPFSLSTDPRFLYHSTAHDRAAQEMLSAIRRRDAVVVITGDPGTGKTMLCRAVMEELDRRTLTAFVADPLLPPDDLLKTVLVDFGVITREQLDAGHLASASRASLMAALRDFLASLTAIEAFAVMFIDDANLLSLDLLEQLRLITDLHEDARLLQIALVGEPPLISHLQRPELRAFSARIGARAAVGPLEREEILGYIRQRLLTAGVRPRVDFDDSALDALFAMSRGVPRTVNRLCDRALTLGAAASAGVIDAALIGRAAEECGVTAPPPVRAGRSVTRTIVAFVVLALLGAGAAAWVFREPLTRLVMAWERAPAPPPRPPIAVSPRATPVPAPAGRQN